MTTAIPVNSQQPSSQQFAVIGGGITGLYSAFLALQRGEKNIHVYESTNRMGGKIQSGNVGGQTINRGAEFIDGEHSWTIALAHHLGVRLIENKGMKREEFQQPDGKVLKADDFYATYKPYADQIIRDREEITNNPNGAKAKLINSLTLEQYTALLEQAIIPAPRSFWRALVDTVMFRGNSAQQIMNTAAHSFASEVGQPLGNISATQFLAETSPTADTFLASDCKYRVEGGTEALIVKLREKLEANGVQFHTGAQLNKMSKLPDGKTSLIFSNPDLNSVAGKTILALPAYAYKTIQGLDTLGLSAQSQAQLANTQYTNSFKLTIAFKPGMNTPDATFLSPDGFQCWSPAPGLLTFLSNADEIGTKPAKQVIMERLESYAKAHGSSAEKMFDLKKMDYNNPGAAACYATPRPGEAQALESLRGEMPALAQNNVGIAGTFMPIDGCVGFMECGVLSAQQSVEMLVGREQEKSAGLAHQKQWVPSIEAQRAVAATKSLSAGAAHVR